MTTKYQQRGTSVIWKNNMMFSTVVYSSVLWTEGKRKDIVPGGWTWWWGQLHDLLLFGRVLNYKLNERNLEQPLKKTIYYFIIWLPLFIHFETNCPKNNNSGNLCFAKKCWISQYPCLFFFFFPLKISCIVREEKSSLTHKCILILMYIWYRPQSNLIKCTLPVVSYNKLAALVPGKINTDL